MKQIFFMIAIVSLTFVACSDSNQKESDDMSKMDKDTTTQTAATADDNDVKTVAVTYTSLDPKIAASVKEVVGHYLHIKNALASDNGDEASSGGKAMYEAMNKIDKSLFTDDQKKVYEENEEDLKEHAEHIGKSKIDHSREHFAMMSEEVYALVKAFGAGKPLYHDHCPIYDNSKGALWLSETKEIRNPYMGSKMPTCGTVEEKIQ